ncbi:MAG: NAD(P)H-binding protein [Acidobacteria bacterium]|nr:NAD(P)H-binding protein [Acidobacteriota bacterium]
MNIAIFGANGATGRLITQYALAAGHTLTVLLRTPKDFPYLERLTLGGHVVHGSAFDPHDVARTIQGADVVFSALGAKSPLRNENVLPRAVPLIVKAMQQSPGTKRLIVLGSAGALPGSLAQQPAWRRWVVQKIVYPRLLKWPVYEQKVQYLALLSSGLDWTMVMPPMLTNGRERGNIRIDGEALPPNASSISRASVARFMLQQIEDPEWRRKGVYISN